MNEILETLDPQFLEKIKPLVEKWDTYCSKVEDRLNEIFTEADEGITEVMAINPHDHEPLFAAFKMVDSRFLKIAKKMRDAIDKMEEDWEKLLSALNEKQLETYEKSLDKLLIQMLKRGRALDDGLENTKELWQTKKQAEWADLLAKLVEKEKHHRVVCTGCGSDLEMTTLHTMSNVSCPYCSVANTITPPPATLLYYSWGIQFQATMTSISEYKAMLEAENKYNHRSKAKTKSNYKEAINNYWIRYYKQIQALYPNHPHLAEGLDTAIERKVNHATFAM